MKKRRRDLVMMAFSKLDKDGSGQVTYDDIKDVYDASKHPDVLARKRSEQSVLLEFLSHFEIGGVVDGVVSVSEFLNYYTNLSSCIDRDDYFELMIRNAWHLSGGKGSAENTANMRVLVIHVDGTKTVETVQDDMGLKGTDFDGILKRIQKQGIKDAVRVTTIGNVDESEEEGKGKGTGAPLPLNNMKISVGQITPAQQQRNIQRLRDMLTRRGSTGILGLGRKFKQLDDNGNGSLSLDEFSHCLLECGVQLSEVEMKEIFRACDTDRSGEIDYEEFLAIVRVRRMLWWTCTFLCPYPYLHILYVANSVWSMGDV